MAGELKDVIRGPVGLEDELSGRTRRNEERVEAGKKENDEIEVTPATLEDLGKLGEGASGEVRRVRHKPTGIVMAKKVSFRRVYEEEDGADVVGDRRSRPLRTRSYTSSTFENSSSCANVITRISCSTTALSSKT